MYTIFLVEDEPICLRGVASILKTLRPQCTVHALPTADAALHRLDEAECDLLITDIQMPGMNGLDMIEAFQRRGKHPLSVILSVYNDFPHMQRAMRLNVKDFLLKPVDEDSLGELLARIESKIAAATPTPEDAFAADIRAYVLAHFADPDLSLTTLAERFRFSTAYMSTWFKNKMGENFLRYLNGLRMERAAKLLAAGSKVHEVSTQVGFADAKYFIRVFKQHHHMTPDQYRRARRGEP